MLVQSAGTNVALGFSYSLLLTAALLVAFGSGFAIFARPGRKIKMKDDTFTVA